MLAPVSGAGSKGVNSTEGLPLRKFVENSEKCSRLRRTDAFLDFFHGQAIVVRSVLSEKESVMCKWCGWLLVGLVAVPGLPALAQTPKTGKTYVLKASRMFDGKSSILSSPGLVVVTDGKISGVGAKAVIPAGAETIDLGDATLLPGFIDAHTHLTAMDSDDWKQNTIDRLQKTVAEQALDAGANARVTLMAGLTTAREVGSSDYLDVGLRNATSEPGVPRTRILVTAHAICSPGGP